MKRPCMSMRVPWSQDYENRTVDVTIYSWFESWMEDHYCTWCGEEDCYGECEENEDEEEFKNPQISLDQISLQKIIDLLPPTVKPSDVKIKMSTDSGDYPTGHYITFYYKKFLPADPEGYKRDKAKYDAAYAEYKKQEAAYDEYVKQQEIKQLEAKLFKLKK